MSVKTFFFAPFVAAILCAAPAWAQPISPAAPTEPAPAEPPPALTKAPRLVHFVEAVPPKELAPGESVDVILLIDIDAQGAVQAVAPSKSGGAAYDDAAMSAARQFRFEPGQYQGKPVPVRITYRYRFVSRPAAPPIEAKPAAGAIPSAQPAIPTVPFSGVVLRKGDRTPLEGVVVALDEGTPSTRTDSQGHFEIDTAPIGSHAVHLRGSTIVPSDSALVLNAGKRATATYYVAAKERYVSTVRAQRAVQQVVEETLAAEELRHIPGTQGDTLKAVQNLPGVARSPFGGGLLVVWGSAPQDTRTYIDGVYIPTLYHFGGLRSTVNSEMVESLTFLPGGYGAEYGRGLGGVISVDTRRPRTDAVHGFVQLDLFDGSFMFEGPLSKTVSVAVSARRSWIDAFLPFFTTNDFQLSPIYWDYQAKLTWRATQRDTLDFFFFGSDDTLSLLIRRSDPQDSPSVDSHIFYHRGLVHWLHRLAGAATLNVTASLGYDVPFQFVFNEGNVLRSFDMETLEYSLRAELATPIRSWLSAQVGLDYEGNRWPIAVTFGPTGPPRDGDPGGFGGGGGGAFGRGSGLVSDDYTLYSNGIAPFAAATFSLLSKRLVITPQLRLEVLSESAYGGTPFAWQQTSIYPEPRLTARWQVLPWLAPKLATGLYHQLPQPLDVSRGFGNPQLGPETGFHAVTGVDFDPAPAFHIEVEGFYKDLRDLAVRGEHPGDPPLVDEGKGRVYGGEVLVRRELTRHFFGWIAYTLSHSERQDHPDLGWRLFQFDQTHILTMVGSYILPRGYQVGLRFRYVTGNPYTKVQQSYYDNNADRYVPIFGPTYGARLDAFEQLDFRLDKSWTYDRWKLTLYLDLQNITNAANPEGIRYNFNFTQTQPQAGLPFLPIFGVRGEI